MLALFGDEQSKMKLIGFFISMPTNFAQDIFPVSDFVNKIWAIAKGIPTFFGVNLITSLFFKCAREKYRHLLLTEYVIKIACDRLGLAEIKWPNNGCCCQVLDETTEEEGETNRPDLITLENINTVLANVKKHNNPSSCSNILRFVGYWAWWGIDSFFATIFGSAGAFVVGVALLGWLKYSYDQTFSFIKGHLGAGDQPLITLVILLLPLFSFSSVTSYFGYDFGRSCYTKLRNMLIKIVTTILYFLEYSLIVTYLYLALT